MEKDIKTRAVKKDIKTLTKTAGVTRSIKNVGVKSKQSAEDIAMSAKGKKRDGRTYAETQVEDAASSSASAVSSKAASQIKGVASQGVRARRLSKEAARATSKKATDTARAATKGAAPAERASIKTASKSVKTASTKAKALVKATRQARVAAKSARQAAASTRTATSAAKMAARNAAQGARAAARIASLGLKAAVRGIASFTKMAIAAAKSLGAAIAAIGGTAAAAIVIVCLVALIAVSAFGIFFTGGDMGDGNPTLREVVSEINEEHSRKIDEIRSSNAHDEFALTGTKTPWKEVLAVFSVKTTTDADDPLDVVTLDEKRQQLLKDVFWGMNSIDHRVEEREVTEIVLEEDEDGNQVEATKTSTVKTLYVTLSSKLADEVARTFDFSAEQFDLLHQLLDPRQDSTWQSVLYGVRPGSGDIVGIALTQVGNVGGQPYWSWYGFGGRVEWCACFVSWCANEAGCIEAGIIPKFSYCPTGVDWFKSAGLWQDGGYAPQSGDIIFFDWGVDGVSDHVGIVESCDGSTVKTVEGNSGDACMKNNYDIDSHSILGYGTPIY